jgi:excisionase family DNA binding protein
MGNLLLLREFAANLWVSRQTIYRMIREKKVQPYRVGGRTVFWEADLEQLVQPMEQLVSRNPRGQPRKVPPVFPV